VQNFIQKTIFSIEYFFGRFCPKNGGRTAANSPGKSLSFFGRFSSYFAEFSAGRQLVISLIFALVFVWFGF
jgi:hypothetical protein